ncbi:MULTISPECIES: phenylalanine--tRNA ligase subunit alpha [Weissella]|jgi:phenylalanyl-tRNA synthetase, alpha subunit|uniref:Phenylalanine--tRNA ligase alpha subunit n=8 Tax=Lactobacillaceae TaxID=33958 RepID=A0A0D1LQB9_9LACO|nr:MULTISPECIES: phenylalanine--tRNA ligase subunit alpha [Weissella]ALI32744.1 phenylalanine--tRNA ligase subunit alpha [Weissella cibaria]AVO67300.1 phenylalanine--tRNA ligase subunit alpha [Weissella cibaria]KIU20675.1 Phenylalanine--tRNA ligase alpha subunit [Weissella cibaria]KIU21966.1 Phenylalanine--tRNA ligase alpha subunit [Weissella cibaria]KIU22290.1 Phenylalanine--tRNA ligase alpha subunit [Weissella cibaria]
MSLQDELTQLRDQALGEIAATADLKALNQVRVNWLGKKGPLTEVLRGMKDLTPEERPVVGALANEVRDALTEAIATRQTNLEAAALNEKLAAETLDVTLPGRATAQGQPHVLQQIIESLEDQFLGMGYQVIEGPEVEQDKYNFEMMNLPKDHPARDMQDTFYITPEILMRTQTSPVQARTLESHDFNAGPLKMVSPGRVYRRDTDDATHSHQFHQMEGLVIDKHITMGDLKGTLLAVARNLFGEDHDIRLRPSYFPFTEPSVEVDVSWNAVTPDMNPEDIEWIEVLGAGMVHPNVLRMAGVDPEVYGGFAFGLGPDRFAMLKYGVEDIRNFYLNDVRFLTQFDQKG